MEVGADDFIVKPIARDVFIRTIRHTLHLSRLHVLIERRQTTIRRAQARHVAIVDRLDQSNERWLNLLRQKATDVEGRTLSGDALRRLETVQRDAEGFKGRSLRHLATLDAFLVQATRAQRHLSEELNRVQEALRGLARSRLQPGE